MEQILRAIPAAPGIAIGNVLWLKKEQIDIHPKESDAAVEQKRLEQAQNAVAGNIQRLLLSLQDRPEEAEIFNAHLMLLSDPDLLEMVKTNLKQGAEYAWSQAIDYYADQLESLQDEYLRSRAVDIRDVGKQVLLTLMDRKYSDLCHLENPVVLLAEDLTPSDTGRMDKGKILGMVTQLGSATSHTAILAKAYNIPAVVGAGESLETIQDGYQIILDGNNGEIVLNPEDTTLTKYIELQKQERERHFHSIANAQLPAVTRDGHPVEVVANIGSLSEAKTALENGAAGVGLLRTEFLYMNRATAPDENTQFEIYRSIFETMEDRPVVIRTMDIGGDKSPSYMDLGHEANPFMGWRAIRVCLDKPDFFKDQLRAIVRASIGHDIRIMFPMISQLSELRQAKILLEEAKLETGIASPIQVGIMVEIPSVVQMIDLFAPEVDFFSIGTNDLTQYTFAVDRTNPKVACLADALHPAVLRQIHRVIQVAHEYGKWVGVCGELAGNPAAIPVLLGLGLDEFSMSASLIPAAKHTLRNWELSAAKNAAAKSLQFSSSSEVREFVSKGL